LPSLLSAADRAAADSRASGWIDAGAGKDLATRLAALDGLAPALDVLHVAGGTPMHDAAGFDAGVGALVTGLGKPGEDVLDDVAAVYFALGESLEFDWLRDRIAALPRDDRWQALARSALGDDYAQERAALTAEILRAGGLDRWLARHRSAVDRFLLVVDDIRSGAPPDLATLSVAMREARALSQSSIEG